MSTNTQSTLGGRHTYQSAHHLASATEHSPESITSASHVSSLPALNNGSDQARIAINSSLPSTVEPDHAVQISSGSNESPVDFYFDQEFLQYSPSVEDVPPSLERL